MKDDLAKLQGVWNIISLEMDGQAIPSSSIRGAKIKIEGDHFTSTGMGAVYEGTMDVDEVTTPKSFNMHFAGGPEKGSTNKGIYELNHDTWRICLATRGTTRPVEFATRPGSGIALEVLERGRS